MLIIFRLLLCLIALLCPLTAHAFDVIAHRGASGFLPEHTLEAATLAHAQGAQYIEQDVVISKDGVAVVLHDIHLETVTDVEAVFPDRARKDGRYYALDFTLAELKRLTVHEREDEQGKPVFPNRFSNKAPRFTIATLAEHIELINELNRLTQNQIGLYTEIKSPAWHQSQGVDISKIVLKVLSDYGLGKKGANVYLQCFDFNEIKRLREVLKFEGKLVQLLAENSWQESPTDYDYLRSSQGLTELVKVADGIGPWLGHLIDPEAKKQGKIEPQIWLIEAKQKGFFIHPYTFRTDALPPGVTQHQLLELLIRHLQVDGLFTDQVPAVNQYLNN